MTGKTMSESCSNTAATTRLCSLFHSFPEFNQISSTKHLLISLSTILRQIKHWIDHPDTEHPNQSGTCPSFDTEGHQCFTYIFSVLISLLNVDDKYTQHVASNIFLTISEFLMDCGGNWDKFAGLLCTCFEFGLCNVLQPSFNGVENFKSIPANLSPVLRDFTWTGVSGITRVLRGVLKHLKGEEDVELVAIILESLSTSLSGIPWEALNGAQNDPSTDARACSGDWNTEAQTMSVGNLVQLLCSLVGSIGCAEDGAGSLNKDATLHKICDLVTKLLRCCLTEERRFTSGRILAYFQHKFLMLMIRISFHMQYDCSVHLLWLQLLHEYFQDFLSRPLSVVQCGQESQNDSLEGSPFLLTLYDQEACHIASLHLQRQTVFLFVRCCLSLSNPRNTSDSTVAGKRTRTLFDSDSNTTDSYFARKKGLLELYGWLQGKVPLDIFSENQMFLEKCIKFTSSFITLFKYEDDMLFEVLLQLLSLSSCPERMFSKDVRSCDTEEDILFFISVLFNPLLVLRVFLAELQYDHQLLLDYLISKDTGSKCAEYLLRCLRAICESWDLLLQLFDGETCFCQSNCKKSFRRMKMILEGSCVSQVTSPLHCGHTVSYKQYENESQTRSKGFVNCSIRIQDAEACLLSLRNSLKKLHKKKLFPYNPELLIKRITRFEVLCDQHVRGGGN